MMDGWPAGYDGWMATIHDGWMETKQKRGLPGPGPPFRGQRPLFGVVSIHPSWTAPHTVLEGLEQVGTPFESLDESPIQYQLQYSGWIDG